VPFAWLRADRLTPSQQRFKGPLPVLGGGPL